MANHRFGVVGPRDLVPGVAAMVARTPGLIAVPLPYGHEDRTAQLLASHRDEVDAWLFTGIVPYQVARAAGLLDRPAAYVSYGAVGFLASITRLALAGTDLSALSIDTLDEPEVRQALAGTGIAMEAVTVLPYRAGMSSAEIVAFHRAARRRNRHTTALTCLSSAYDTLRAGQPTVRLAPAEPDVRATIEALTWQSASRRGRDGTAVIGLVELSDDADVARELAALCGAVVPTGHGRYLVVTTLGPLEHVTDNLTTAPFVPALARTSREVHIGFGLAGSAADAAARAAHALARAQDIDQVAAVVALAEGSDLILGSATQAGSPGLELPVAAARTGVRLETLAQLRDLAGRHGGVLTSAMVAQEFGVQERSARRTLKRLERGGAAVGAPVHGEGQAGRPPLGYRILLAPRSA